MSTPPFPENLEPALQAVRTRPLFVMKLLVKPIVVVGRTPGAFRRIGLVTGGDFRGERLSGTVLDCGNDWQDVRADGAMGLNVRLVLQTDGGEHIAMTYQGLRHGPSDVMAKLDAGEAVDPAQYYFRTAAQFETASSRYDWLNRILAIGIGHRRPDGPVYSLFELE